jgi:O-antigen/teichoic acid export membrane protein
MAKLTINYGLVELFSLLRNILLARMLGPESFGIAIIYLTAFRLIDMATDLGIDRYILQSKAKFTEEFLSKCHGAFMIRNVVCLCLWGLVGSLTHEIAGGVHQAEVMLVVGAALLARCFEHAEYRFEQRSGAVGRLIIISLVSAVGATLLSYPVATWKLDFRSFLWVILLQSLLHGVMTHAVARSPYRISVDIRMQKQLLHFGIPLALNGLLIFSALYGERLVYGLYISPITLGQYAVASQLVILPVLVFMRAYNGHFLPKLAKGFHDGEGWRQSVSESSRLALASGAFLAIGFTLFCNTFITIAYGNDFTVATPVVWLLAIWGMVRVLRVTPTTMAMAQGETRFPLYSNGARSVGICFLLLAGMLGLDLAVMVGIGVLFECVALALAWSLVWSTHRAKLAGNKGHAAIIGLT